jgi:hypothetical protein
MMRAIRTVRPHRDCHRHRNPRQLLPRKKHRHIDASRVVQPTDDAGGAHRRENEMRRIIAILALSVSLAGLTEEEMAAWQRHLSSPFLR